MLIRINLKVQIKDNHMIKLKSLIPEAYTDEFGKNKWVNLPRKALEDYADTIADLVVNAYAGKGGNFEIRTGNDVRTSDLNFWVSNDVDSDVDMDVVVGGKVTPAGTKMTMIGQDGGATAKKVGVTKMIELMKTRGFYAEMDKDMAAKFGLPITKDEADIRKVINKDLKMNPDGSYDRQLTGGPVKTKVLVGIPKV
jgi:hypothetical protein